MPRDYEDDVRGFNEVAEDPGEAGGSPGSKADHLGQILGLSPHTFRII